MLTLPQAFAKVPASTSFAFACAGKSSAEAGSERPAHPPKHLLIQRNDGDGIPLCWQDTAVAVGFGTHGRLGISGALYGMLGPNVAAKTLA